MSFGKNDVKEGGRSNTSTTWFFTNGAYYASTNRFHASYIYEADNPVGVYMHQVNADGLPRDASGNKIPHSTIGNVCVGYDNYVLSSGAITYSAAWSSGDITSSQVDDYVSWVQAEDFGNTIENVVKTSTSLSFDMVAKNETGGRYSLLRYQPDTQFKVTVRDAGTNMCCFLRAQDEGHIWSTGSYSIAGGDTLTINKSGNECYLSFVGDTFEINDVAVADKAVKNLTSSSVTVENTGTEARKIGVIWRD